MTPFLFVTSWLMKNLPRNLAVKTSASSSADSVASLSTSGHAQSLMEKSAWKQTSGVTYLLWRAACVASVESSSRSPNSWPQRECHGRSAYIVKHLPTCAPARHAMSVHVTCSDQPFRMTANAASRKTGGAPHRPIDDTRLICSFAEPNSS